MRSRKRKPINSSKTVIDGMTFDSKIEGYMYRLLRDSNIPHKVHKEFTLLEDEGLYKADVFVRAQKRSKELKSTPTSRSIKKRRYTPDFVDEKRSPRWVIEVKGRKLGDFSLRWNLFKRRFKSKNVDLFMPVTKKDCEQTLRIIKERYYE